MLKRCFVSLALSLSCALLLAACGGAEAPANNSSTANASNQTSTTTTTTTTTSTPATTTSTPTTTTTVSSGEKIGIPECDDYLAKYEACLTTKIPDSARAQFNTALERTRDAWRKMASTAQGKAGLAQACRIATDQTKIAMQPYGCDF
jgi:hypothetical protein